ncbi:MAG: Crp/Fnr family transcriptional regulator [Rhizobiaceae bacterium]|nr:Crp/Fnr family transcriptional regulator [Rhizobiaceae bacterium]
MTDSCLVAKLSHYIELSPTECTLLARLEESTEHYVRRDIVVEQGERIADIYVVKNGWICGHVSNASGVDLIAEIFYPGDVLGMSQLAFETSTVTYIAATELSLCPFPKEALKTIFREHPRLVALFFAFTTLERATMIDRLRAMGQMSARDCVGLFFLQTKARLKITGRAGATWFQMPLSQELIGNAVGLSTVSVNRAIRQLETEGHIRRQGRMIEIVKPEVLGRELDFTDRHYRIDNSWFPLLD